MIERPRPVVNMSAPQRWIEKLPIASARPLVGVAATLAIVMVAFVIRLTVDPMLPSGFPYVTFFPAVIVTSFVFGARLGSVAAVLCGLLAWYFFIPPFGFGFDVGEAFALGFYAFVAGTDLALVHWMQTANRQLAGEREVSRALAQTRELLFQELQHRVSNNLQVAAGLLNMQKRGLSDPAGRAALDQAAGRLALIGRISRQLYDPNGAANTLLPFLAELGRSVIEANDRADLILVVNGDEAIRLIPDAAIPTAIIVAEAVVNAIEHGFAEGRAGTITISIDRESFAGLKVTVHDDGSGLPDHFEMSDSDSLGLRIAATLAKGQGGTFLLQRDGGTSASLSLPSSAVSG